MRRHARLLATAALGSMVVAGLGGGPVDALHGLRDAAIGAGSRLHLLPGILTGAITSDLNLHKGGLPLPLPI
ncbi:hypothetical protein [Nonomuraea sp. SYSU D8015]|uniref:hypothetical protein n=1 Tax=Nonomuraea sp. SYSU D8015 TaxID=2593644 RepID=UPI0016609243|nr:hypothetical protein [Nonomuraea sp. SYSU D8015]